MKTGQATVINQYGIHCRPSTVIAKAAQLYQGTVTVRTPTGKEVEATSVLSLVSLGLTPGATVTIRVSGPDEDVMCARMVELFSTDFDFSRPATPATRSGGDRAGGRLGI